jgi:L-threonylcarbamoyladenylate synthase
VIPFRSDADVDAAVPEVLRHLVQGGLIAYPTETVYGFGSLVAAGPVARLSALKGRAPGKPFLVLVTGLGMLRDIGLRLTDAAERLAAAFWPGALTLVLPGGEGLVPIALRGPEGGVAARWTSHPGAARLIATIGSPLTSTSANRTREPAARDAAGITGQFKDDIARGTLLVLDAGRLPDSPPSTVVDCTGIAPRVIRRGAVDSERLRSIVPALVDE